MSSITAADEVTVAADTVEKAPRRFPAPCWTQEEALALIDVYRERWYDLRRGYLRTADWDAVAAEVISRCPGSSPEKTSAQCRHKMEKLRQRYRAEKQRAFSFPYPAGRYLSSWFFFENMEAMENGTTSPTSGQMLLDGSRSKSPIDHKLFKLKLKANNNPESSTDLRFDNSAQAKRFSPATKIRSQYSPFSDVAQDDDFTNRGIGDQPMNRISIQTPPPLKYESKKSVRIAGFHQQMHPPGLRINEFGSDFNRSNPDEDFSMKFPNNNSNKFVDPAGSKCWSSSNPNSECRSAMKGLKRGRYTDGLDDIVASIELLGRGFLRIEKEKMELGREMELARMEMAMKRNQILVESQKQILDAFIIGLFELKNTKKLKSGVAADPAHP